MNLYYYIVPVKIEYELDEDGNQTTTIASISPSVTAGRWVADCKDGVNYLVKTNSLIDGLDFITEENFNAEVSAIGFDPAKVILWNGGW